MSSSTYFNINFNPYSNMNGLYPLAGLEYAPVRGSCTQDNNGDSNTKENLRPNRIPLNGDFLLSYMDVLLEQKSCSCEEWEELMAMYLVASSEGMIDSTLPLVYSKLRKVQFMCFTARSAGQDAYRVHLREIGTLLYLPRVCGEQQWRTTTSGIDLDYNRGALSAYEYGILLGMLDQHSIEIENIVRLRRGHRLLPNPNLKSCVTQETVWQELDHVLRKVDTPACHQHLWVKIDLANKVGVLTDGTAIELKARLDSASKKSRGVNLLKLS